MNDYVGWENEAVKVRVFGVCVYLIDSYCLFCKYTINILRV